MKIFHLERTGAGYGEAVAFVVIARDIEQARVLACGRAGAEGPHLWDGPAVTVTILGQSAAGEQARVVLADYRETE
jgi:hypothetical protein